ncbi:MAG: hypothetical protein JWR05_1273 [Mucilaginibacter sp.]|nr:hypothetical protein [Mucilaginibacter sp.]
MRRALAHGSYFPCVADLHLFNLEIKTMICQYIGSRHMGCPFHGLANIFIVNLFKRFVSLFLKEAGESLIDGVEQLDT